MGLNIRIFETDPEARPKPRSETSDIVGRFRSGMRSGRSAVTLDKWRVTTGDPEVASFIARQFGGTVESWDTSGEDNLQVLTDAASVDVVIEGPGDIESDLKGWGMGGQLVHHCDGVVFLSPDEEKGTPCGCPELFAERKAAAKAGRGPKPDTRVTFRLAAAPQLGRFRMHSGSWDLVKVVHEYVDAVERVGGPALCSLGLETVSFVAKSGPMAGRTVSYKKPVLRVRGRWDGSGGDPEVAA